MLRMVCLFTSNLHSVAFIKIKFQLPGEFPLGYRIKVSLQKDGIAFGFDAAVENAIISKETDCTIDGFVGEVVDVYLEIYGAKNSTLGHTREGRMGGGLRPSRNNSLRSPLQTIFWIQVCMVPLLPYQLSLYCRHLCGTLPKVFLKSIMIISVCEGLLDKSWKRKRRCHMIIFLESRVEVHREFSSNLGVA